MEISEDTKGSMGGESEIKEWGGVSKMIDDGWEGSGFVKAKCVKRAPEIAVRTKQSVRSLRPMSPRRWTFGENTHRGGMLGRADY